LVASAGDVNGDGFDDVMVGASRYDHGQTDEGAAFVYNGSAVGLLMAETGVPDP
jgi:FG-GAP repeat